MGNFLKKLGKAVLGIAAVDGANNPLINGAGREYP